MVTSTRCTWAVSREETRTDPSGSRASPHGTFSPVVSVRVTVADPVADPARSPPADVLAVGVEDVADAEDVEDGEDAEDDEGAALVVLGDAVREEVGTPDDVAPAEPGDEEQPARPATEPTPASSSVRRVTGRAIARR
ncbi:hypothetical protein GCM10009814_06570 [Lapillicoccus jejuensis]